MKNVLTFLIIGFSFAISAQDQGKWSLEIRSSYDLYKYDVVEYMNALPTSEVTGLHIIDDKYNYSLGIQSGYKLNEQIDIGFGLTYSNRKSEVTCYCHLCDKIFTPPQETNFEFISLPLFLRYYPLKTKLLSPYLLLGANYRTYLSKEFREGLHKIQMEGKAGIGLQIKVAKNFSLSAESFYLNDLYSISEFSDFKYKGLSFAFGANYHFKK